jgi:ABC-type phosphate transport system substrate-binding protein
MRPKSARHLSLALVLGVAAVAVALVAPGAANAQLLAQCEGASPTTGQGASLLKTALASIWEPDFNTSANSTACSGTQGNLAKPVVKYNSTSSGPGLESWGSTGTLVSDPPGTDGFGVTNAFVGTEEPPNPTEAANIQGFGATGTLETIPVLQSAIAIVVHLPAGCTATSTVAPGRLVLKQATLEKIFQGTDTEWSKIKSTEGGDAFTGCPKKGAHITRVVRAESAGTTAILKKYLGLIKKPAVDGSDTWDDLSEGSLNATWPETGTDPVTTAVKDSGEATEVAATEGSIGYVSLVDARSNGSFTPTPGTGGPGTGDFWVEVENNKTGPTYADPATNGDVAAKENSNCANTTYTNGKKKFPPPLTTQTWNEVTTSKVEANYGICGFAYILSLNDYEDYAANGATQAEATTVADFLNFVLNNESGGGQQLINNNDYLALPANVLTIAQGGASAIDW